VLTALADHEQSPKPKFTIGVAISHSFSFVTCRITSYVYSDFSLFLPFSLRQDNTHKTSSFHQTSIIILTIGACFAMNSPNTGFVAVTERGLDHAVTTLALADAVGSNLLISLLYHSQQLPRYPREQELPRMVGSAQQQV